jgi:hypothetical protein
MIAFSCLGSDFEHRISHEIAQSGDSMSNWVKVQIQCQLLDLLLHHPISQKQTKLKAPDIRKGNPKHN